MATARDLLKILETTTRTRRTSIQDETRPTIEKADEDVKTRKAQAYMTAKKKLNRAIKSVGFIPSSCSIGFKGIDCHGDVMADTKGFPALHDAVKRQAAAKAAREVTIKKMESESAAIAQALRIDGVTPGILKRFKAFIGE